MRKDTEHLKRKVGKIRSRHVSVIGKIAYHEKNPREDNSITAVISEGDSMIEWRLERFSNEEVDLILTAFQKWREKGITNTQELTASF